MILQIESFPNELFLHGIFPYLSFIDINYGFVMLNNRFEKLVSCFLSVKLHHLHIRRDRTWHEITYLIDSILPYLQENHQLKTIEFCHADLSLQFFNNIDQFNTNYLRKIIVTRFIDIHFDRIIQFLSKSIELEEIQLKVLTNLDSSWANGRKWNRWFETLLQNNRQCTLKSIDICVWCINTNDPIYFDSRFWNRDGIYKHNQNWKVKLEPEQTFNLRQSRRTVEFSRCNQDYAPLFHQKQKSTCILS